MSDKLNQAIITIKAGNKQTGKQLLIEILKSEPHNENVWLWMTQVVSKKDDKIKCLEQVLKINPDNEIAQKGMARLRPAEPPSLDDIAPETNAPVIQRKKRERTESTIRQLEKTGKPRTTSSPNNQQRQDTEKKPTSSMKWPLILAGILIGGVVLCIALILAPAMLITPRSNNTSSANNVTQSTSQPAPTSDIRFTITQNSLGSKNALEKEITNKGWKFKEVETMSDGTRCDTYESSHVVFRLCAVGDELKAIVIRGDEFADFNPVFAIASMYDIRYFGDFKDAVTDTWFDLPFGESTVLDLDTDGVIMTIQRTYDDGYGITYILESHLP